MADAPQREEGLDAAEVRLNRLLNTILESAVELLGFDAATVSVRRGGDVATIAATDQRMIALDDVQYATGEGPCMEVLEPQDPLFLDDVAATEDRWEQFARTASHLGVQSTLSVHVPVDSEGLAASLNLYSKAQQERADERVRTAAAFADQLAAALLGVDAYRSMAKLARELAQAMRSRAMIEQAKGILMANNRIDADAAFAQLVQLSQHANVKLHDVARRLVEERTRPE